MAKNKSAFGLYFDSADVSNAVDALKNAGFRNTDIAVLFPENTGTKDLVHSKSSKAPEGTVAGAGVGAVAGGVMGWLAALGTYSMPINGWDQFVSAGPVVAALAGIGALGIVGALFGGIAGSATPEYEARRYEGRLKKAGILLSVHCDDQQWLKRATGILKHTGADEIGSSSEAKADFAVGEKPSPRTRHARLIER